MGLELMASLLRVRRATHCPKPSQKISRSLLFLGKLYMDQVLRKTIIGKALKVVSCNIGKGIVSLVWSFKIGLVIQRNNNFKTLLS